MSCARLALAFLVALMATAPLAVANPAEPDGRTPWPAIEYGYPEQAPRVFTNSRGEADGYYIRLLGILFKRANIEWRATSFPAKRLMANLDNGSTQLSILVKNSVLDKCCLYGTTSVWHDELRAYSIGNKPPLRNREDLRGKRIITISGFSYGGLIDYLNHPGNDIINNAANSRDAAFDMLEAGRADYLLDYAEAADAQRLATRPIANLHSTVIDTIHMYLVVNKNYPNAAGLIARLEVIYKNLRAEDGKREYTK